MDEDPNADTKAAAAVRGIGLTKAYVYVEDPEDKGGDPHLCISLTDYFEGEETTISVKALNGDVEGDDLEGTPVETCNGKAKDIDLKICGKEARYVFPAAASARITITYGGIANSIDITPTNRKGWIDWS